MCELIISQSLVMESFPTFLREVLVMTNTSFSKRFCAMHSKDATHGNPTKEQWEAVCSNGLLLPELLGNVTRYEKTLQWQVEIRNRVLKICGGEEKSLYEKQFTLDCHDFLFRHRFN